ncbi:hypothetical protein C2S51_036527 [Perilla frutescens var. frutescens]|nr:hypothetical protein C2S51_036527 [Perilla frutescens var. frutescens]
MDHQQCLCAALCILTVFEFCTGADTLSANQTLADGEVLISPGQTFELGFFSPGSSATRFLGIRYRATPDVVVWVANRERPITSSPGVLALAKNGTLVLNTTQSSNIWSPNITKAASSPVLQLLDSGNLVIIDKATTDSSWRESYIWQSFDHPGDTLLPGMKMVHDPETGEDKHLTSWRSADDPSIGEFSYRIENQGLSQAIIVKGVEKVYRAIFWNGHFPGFPAAPYKAWKTEVQIKRGRLVSIFQPFNDSVKTRIVMNYSGSTQRYVMNEQEDGWILMLTGPRDLCDSYGLCGRNGVCKINKTPVCECLRGFKPTSVEEWGNFNWSSGCTRNLTLDCQKEDGFLRVEGLKFPDSLNFQLNTGMSIGECRNECLKKCTCSAYADPFFKNETSCLMWFGDLIDTREQTIEPGGGPNIYIRVPVSEIETNWKERRKGHTKTKIIIIAAASSFGMLILGLSFGGLLLTMRRKRQVIIWPSQGILSAEQVIAVKRMSKTSGQGPEEFKSEENRELEMMDPCYKSSYVEPQVKRCIQIGLLCVQNAANERPMMPSVVMMLSTEDTVLPQPNKPGFFLQSSSSFSKRNTSGNEMSSSATITMSDVEAR